MADLDSMPTEMVAAIIDRLSAADRFVCTLVSPVWRALALASLARDRHTSRTRPWQRRTFLAQASYEGRLGLVQWAVSSGCPWDNSACVEAARGGHGDIVVWLREAGCPLSTSECLVAAAGGGHLDLVKQWLAQQHDEMGRTGYRVDKCQRLDRARYSSRGRCLYQAALNRHYDVLRVLLADPGAPTHEACTTDTISVALLECIDSARYHSVPECASECAAARGCIESLEWLQQRGRLRIRSAYRGAALHVHDNVLGWLPDTTGDRFYLAVGAARRGRLDILQSLREHSVLSSFQWRRVAVEAAHSGHLDVLQWVDAMGVVRMPSSLTLAAAYSGHSHVLVWAFAKGIRISGLSTSVAAVRGHTVASHFCERVCDIPLYREFDEPIWHGNVEWRRSAAPFQFGPRRHALDMACEHGGADVIAGLAESMLMARSRPTRGALAQAMRLRDPYVVACLSRGDYEAWRKAAHKCDIAMVKHLYALWGLPPAHVVQDMFVEAARSRYGWRPVFEWLVWRGARCERHTTYNMGRHRAAPQAIAWAADHG
ncbi:Ankyrin repeat protein [Pandoravirus kuranda]|uniref:Ankyrin repeat protein n=2 Tax=Pandoravirus TaxID=2060084 RepID=A0AA95J6P0_9VIRU|nr:Ankyrin repeat domain containing protein [Pandoravirus neocaledonia]AVK76094.1 Ankyrin repeat domain containing protein [Pandoravirus neocaledonia]WBR14625.1 Ankyrin repeat protein [Pandoravirus kuranda]